MSIGLMAGLAGVALIATLVTFVVTLLVTGFILFVAGKIVVGGRATFGKAVTIAFLGSIVGFILSILLPGIGWILALVAWIYFIKSYFGTGWLVALGIAILAVVVSVVIAMIMAIVFGIAMFTIL